MPKLAVGTDLRIGTDEQTHLTRTQPYSKKRDGAADGPGPADSASHGFSRDWRMSSLKVRVSIDTHSQARPRPRRAPGN